MIKLSRSPTPPVLVENGAKWSDEYVAWSKHRTGTEPRRYANHDVRAALEADTSSKCAYCEGRINDVSYSHIEHQRPKKLNPSLVCEWDNLTLACPRCNTNKGEYDDPQCPLLDPFTDDVEDEIAFGGPLALPRGGPRARLTINKLDLNRSDLMFSRGEALWHLYELLELIERAQADVPLVKALWTDVDRLVAAQAEFSSACRYFVDGHCQERNLSRPP